MSTVWVRTMKINLWMVFIIFIIGMFAFMIFDLYTATKFTMFCERNYPSEKGLHTYYNKNVEPGYIECCRNYFTTEHIREEECKVFKKP